MKVRNTSNINWGDYFAYDELSPSCLRYVADRPNSRIKAGMVAGKLTTPVVDRYSMYYMVNHNNSAYMTHRIVWELLVGRIQSGNIIDHLDGDGTNNNINNLMEKPIRQNAMNKVMQVNNSSGITGVYKNLKKSRSGNINEYWMASWIDTDMVQRTKCFRIDKLGNDEAFKLAVEHRRAKVQELICSGLDYTDRHGL